MFFGILTAAVIGHSGRCHGGFRQAKAEFLAAGGVLCVVMAICAA